MPDISKWFFLQKAKKENIDKYILNKIPNLKADFEEVIKFVNKYFCIVFEEDLYISELYYVVPEIENLLDFKNLISVNYFSLSNNFTRCSYLKELPDISKWDTKKVTNLFGLFAGC